MQSRSANHWAATFVDYLFISQSVSWGVAHDFQNHDSKIWSCVPRDSETTMTVLAKASNNLPDSQSAAIHYQFTVKIVVSEMDIC
jgi:hypothetical protein